MIEKVKGLSICGRCFSKKTNLTFFPNDNDRIAIVTVKMAAVKVQFQMAFLKLLPARIQKNYLRH